MSEIRRVLVDSYAILKWTQKEPGYKKVKNLMLGCRQGAVAGYMNYLNLGESITKASERPESMVSVEWLG